MAVEVAPVVRSLYRSILRELPRRSSAARSPLQTRLRETLASAKTDADSVALTRQLEEAKQFVQYAKAQRTYVHLLERYNPGADMSEPERVKMTARRVGMDLPIEIEKEDNGEGKQ